MNKTLNQLKILYLIKTMDVGGAERFTFNLCKYFSEKVKDITVFSSGGIFVDELKNLNIRHIKSPFANSKNFLRLRSELKKTIKANYFDIIHCQHRIFLPILKTINTSSTKVIYTANNFFDDLYQKIIFPDAAVAISPLIEKNLLETTFIDKKKIYRINYGVDIKNKFKPLTEDITIGFIGRLIKEKGIYQLLKSFKEIKTGKLKLIICGDGPEKKNILKIIETENLGESIRFLSPAFNIDDVYSLIDVLILPTSLNEGLPVSILEALARKIIVVTTGEGAIKDVIADNETGLLLKNNTVKSIIERINYLLNNIDKLESIKNNGYKKVKDEFSIEVMCKGYERLIQNVKC